MAWYQIQPVFMNLWENVLNLIGFYHVIEAIIIFTEAVVFLNCIKISSFGIFVFLCKKPSPKIFFNEDYKKNLSWVGGYPWRLEGGAGGYVNIVVKFKWSSSNEFLWECLISS